MELAEIRTKIDETDREIRELLLKRMGYSHLVAEAKMESGDTTIYRADREASILETLGDTVDEELRSEYLSVVRKVMETSRMYQYGLIFDWTPQAFESVKGHELIDARGDKPTTSVTVRLSREDRPNAMSAILSMIGDYGYNMDRMVPVTNATDEASDTSHASGASEKKGGMVTFDLTILGNLTETSMQKLMFQLNGECLDFEILAAA